MVLLIHLFACTHHQTLKTLLPEIKINLSTISHVYQYEKERQSVICFNTIRSIPKSPRTRQEALLDHIQSLPKLHDTRQDLMRHMEPWLEVEGSN